MTLDDLKAFLAGRGIGKEYFPEYLAVVHEMPMPAGGKIAKNELKSWLAARLGNLAGMGEADIALH